MQRRTRVQVDSNAYLGPASMPQGLEEAVPRIRLSLATTIEPFEQRLTRQRHIPLTALCVVRNRLGVPLPLYPPLSLPQQGARGEQGAVSAYPLRKPRQCLLQFLPSRLALDLEGTMPGFATKESPPQKRPFLGFFSPLVGVGPGIAPKFGVWSGYV